jgi:hypothetical protein
MKNDVSDFLKISDICPRTKRNKPKQQKMGNQCLYISDEQHHACGFCRVEHIYTNGKLDKIGLHVHIHANNVAENHPASVQKRVTWADEGPRQTQTTYQIISVSNKYQLQATIDYLRGLGPLNHKPQTIRMLQKLIKKSS